MKKALIIIAVVLMIGNNVDAQITLDQIVDSLTMDYWFKPVQISPTETKYYKADTVTNTFSLYNMDFSPFLLNVAVPDSFIKYDGQFPKVFQVLYITKSLFDCDTSNIEYVYEAATDINFPFRILRTDGTVLFKMDHGNGPYCFGDCLGGSDFVKPIVNTSAGTKLFLQTDTAGYTQTFIYSLCGTLPEDVFDFHQQQQSYVKVFPNPTSNTLTFQINPPDNMNEYELVVVDGNAKEVRREKVGGSRSYTMDVKDLAGGSYFYSLCTKDRAFGNGKFVINK